MASLISGYPLTKISPATLHRGLLNNNCRTIPIKTSLAECKGGKALWEEASPGKEVPTKVILELYKLITTKTSRRLRLFRKKTLSKKTSRTRSV
jgi:hypothetical protein